jgi:serine phosphatase RsbU (regulator of sigma subunit)
MIGVTPGRKRQVSTVPIPPGALLCFYTDGLIERPDQLIDEGLERLRRVVAAESPETACSAVMGALVGNQSARDDIALLMIRRQPHRADSAHHPTSPLAQEEVRLHA